MVKPLESCCLSLEIVIKAAAGRKPSKKNFFTIFAPSFVNSSHHNRFKCCNLHDLFNIFLDNGVMNTLKGRILSLVLQFHYYYYYSYYYYFQPEYADI